jgi:hypothetical protein
MNTRRRTLLIIILACCLGALSCDRLHRKNYNLEKTSPNGTYMVKVDVTVDSDDDWFGSFDEIGKVQIMKKLEVVDSNEWKRHDTFELTFIQANPVVEWVGNNVLRMGQTQEGQPFLDEVVVSNNTDQLLKMVTVGGSKFEDFSIMDLAPRDRISLQTLPFSTLVEADGSTKYSLIYTVNTQDGEKFVRRLDVAPTRPREAGRVVFNVEIGEKDLLGK